MADKYGINLTVELTDYRARVCARPAYDLATKANQQ